MNTSNYIDLENILVKTEELNEWAENILESIPKFIVDTRTYCGDMSLEFPDPTVKIAEDIYIRAKNYAAVGNMYLQATEQAEKDAQPFITQHAAYRSIYLFLFESHKQKNISQSGYEKKNYEQIGKALSKSKEFENKAIEILKKYEKYPSLKTTFKHLKDKILGKEYWGSPKDKPILTADNFPEFYKLIND